MPSGGPILILGAGGAQGGAVLRALLALGRPVRAFVRDPGSPASIALARQGAALAPGSFESRASLVAAMKGCSGIFSVQTPPTPLDRDAERKQGEAILNAARRAGIAQVVHSSVSNTGDFRGMVGWSEGRWEPNYWESKADVEAMVRDGGFPTHTILRPAFMMENFASPKAGFMFPDLREGRIVTAVEPETRIALIAADDIGAAAAAAFGSRDRFAGMTIEMAGDHRTLTDIAAAIAERKNKNVRAETWPADALVERSQHAGWVETQQWLNVVGYPARPEAMREVGLVPTSLEAWVGRYHQQIPIGAAD